MDLPFQYLTTALEGQQNQFVANVQALINLRAATHVVDEDGRYGPKTAAIVRLIQSEEGITVDGECGPQTLKAIWNGRARG